MPTRSVSRRSGWVALLLTTVARMLLFVLASLTLWGVAPAALGLEPTVVMTGSMLPRLVPGDVVLSRPVPPAQLQLGQTLLFPDPDQPGHLRMHRWVDVAADGRLVTKGDANPSNDSTTITRADALGVASLRVPFIGRPVLWAADGRHDLLVLAGLGLVAVVAAAFWFRAEDEPAADDEAAADDEGPHDDEGDRPIRRLPRQLARTGMVLLAVVGLGAGYAGTADAANARFGRTTVNPTDTWNASTYFSCAKAVRGAGAYFSWPLSETRKTTVADTTGNGRTGEYDGTPDFGTAGPCAVDGTTGVTLNGTSDRVDHGSVDLPAGAAVTLQVWFRTTGTRGGVLMSVTDGAALAMAIAMTTSGTLVLGARTPGVTRVTSPLAYRDNAWHLATGTLGSGGLELLVDGQSVASTTSASTAISVKGDPRVGYGDANDLGVGTYNFFQGSVAFGTLFRTALTPAETTQQYQAARPA